MASLGHVAVGLAAARMYHRGTLPRWPSMAAWSALSLLPDVDVIGFGMGVAYGDPWGHRGATHSLTFSVALGVALGLAAPIRRLPAVRTAVFASLVLVSHALLDTLTDGGLGSALLWPFDLTRYFAPWNPIPVAPIGLDFFSISGLVVSLVELVLFSPVLVWALRPGRRAPQAVALDRDCGRINKALLVVWFIVAWLLASRDPVRDALVGVLLREDTVYASGFSERVFRTIRPGQSDVEVRRLVGAPLAEDWFYASCLPGDPRELPAASVHAEADVVVSTRYLESCGARGIESGTRLGDVQRLLGLPIAMCWEYSRSPRDSHYRQRMVCFSNRSVDVVIRRWIMGRWG